MMPVRGKRSWRWGTGLTVEEFWSLGSWEPNTCCLLWAGPIGDVDNGYANAKVEGLVAPVHHHAYRLATGKTPKRGHRHHVMHACDQKACFNPDHLVAGTARQNMQDYWRKVKLGRLRRPHGKLHPGRRPTLEEFEERWAEEERAASHRPTLHLPEAM